jgi:hypothetical protein
MLRFFTLNLYLGILRSIQFFVAINYISQEKPGDRQAPPPPNRGSTSYVVLWKAKFVHFFFAASKLDMKRPRACVCMQKLILCSFQIIDFGNIFKPYLEGLHFKNRRFSSSASPLNSLYNQERFICTWTLASVIQLICVSFLIYL